MTKLHELIAVEASLASQAKTTAKQVNGIFTTGSERLRGEIRTYAPLDDEGEQLPDEVTRLATTVEDELKTFAKAFTGWLDVAVQKEVNNMHTGADVKIDGVVLFKKLPSTALLNLEGKLAELRSVYKEIPTLIPTEQWSFDEGLGYWVSSDRITHRTKKEPRVIVKYDATPEHPAQTDIMVDDVFVGRWTKTIQSGALTVADKRARLERIDELQRAVKQARQRANDLELVSKDRYAGQLFEYINKGELE
jgi:hypothetical protein